MPSVVITLPLFVVSDCICVGGKIGVLQIAARKREREVSREIFHDKLNKRKWMGTGELRHRAAGSWSWRKVVQQLETRAEDFDKMSTNTDSSFWRWNYWGLPTDPVFKSPLLGILLQRPPGLACPQGLAGSDLRWLFITEGFPLAQVS